MPLAVCAALLAASPAAAESLAEAMQLAYQNNPTLKAQRAELRATDEGYVQARSGYGPQVNLTGQYGYQLATIRQPGSLFSAGGDASYRAANGAADLSLVQPLYSFGLTRARVAEAKDAIAAGGQTLRHVEDQVLQNVVIAYMDVSRDRQILQIIRDEIVALRAEFEEIQAKGQLGQLTRTDVAQAQSRVLGAEAQLNLAQGRLKASDAEYLDFVGRNPGDLETDPRLVGVPDGVDQAFDAAERNNAQLLAAIQTERVARERVNEAKAANGPAVSLRIDAAVAPLYPYQESQYDRSVTAATVVSLPLFTSGLNSSRTREALEEDNRAMLLVEATRRDVIELVAQAWDALASNRSALAIEAQELKVQAIAVEGNRIEERVGQRSTIDLLNAELELTNARISLLQSRHDAYVASASLLSAMGLLEIGHQVPGAQIYDAQAALDRVKGRYAPPWEGLLQAVDSVAAPHTPAPSVSSPNAGGERPADLIGALITDVMTKDPPVAGVP